MRGKALAIPIISLIFINSLAIVTQPHVDVQAATTEPSWQAQINITDNHGSRASVTLGKAQNASDGRDSYDIALPPPQPVQPYIRAWFQTSFSQPYTTLMTEYKAAASTISTWNFSIIWIPAPGNITNTTITLHWNPSIFARNLSSCNLTQNTTTIADMTAQSTYTFISNGTLASFQIISHNIQAASTSLPILPIIAILIIVILVIFSIIFIIRRKRK